MDQECVFFLFLLQASIPHLICCLCVKGSYVNMIWETVNSFLKINLGVLSILTDVLKF